MYSYRNGQKMGLHKKDDEIVVRATPEALRGIDATVVEQVSTSATRLQVEAGEMEAIMAQCRSIGPTHHAYYCDYDDQSFDITDRILVTFKEEPTDTEVDAICGKYALRILKQYSDRDFLLQLTNDTGMNPIKVVVRITEQESGIAFAEHDLNMKMGKHELTPPSDAEYLSQWHLHTHMPPSSDFDPRSSTHCETAWKLLDSFGNPAVVLALSDDGCKLNHEDFNSPGKFAAWGYFEGIRLVTNADIDANPSKMYQSGNDHGTSCAGVIAGEADGVLTVGAAPGCRLLPIKWENVPGGGLAVSDSKLLAALNFIRDKADVFSNSWGSSPSSRFSSNVLNQISQLTQGEGRRGKGIVFLWAAGNENCPIEHASNIDVPFTNGWEVQANAFRWVGVKTSKIFTHNLTSIPGVLYCAALASNAQCSHYSNYGTGVLITAPSSNVHTYQRMRVRGLGITTATGESTKITNDFGGTSSATPLIAGIVGLILSANPNLSAAEAIAILLETASKDLNFTPYARTPAANFDTNTAWDVSPVPPFNDGAFRNINSAHGTWSPWFGHGKADAAKAVEKALDLLPVPENINIHAALIKPVSNGINRETVTFRNSQAQAVSIEDWVIRNQANRKQTLHGAVPARGLLTINIDNNVMSLTNTGGTLVLTDAEGVEIDRVSYVRRDVVTGVEKVF